MNDSPDREVAVFNAVLGRPMVERVGRAFGEEAVALRVGVGAEAEADFAGVVNVHVVVHHDDVFGPAVAGSSGPCPSGRAG